MFQNAAVAHTILAGLLIAAANSGLLPDPSQAQAGLDGLSISTFEPAAAVSTLARLQEIVSRSWISEYVYDISICFQGETRRKRTPGIDLSCKAFVDALLETSIKDPAKVVSLYATIGKLRLFASEQTVEAADKVISRILETYCGPKIDLQTKPTPPIRPISFASSLRDVAPNYAATTIENRGPNG